jgi:hypothetical protein
MGRLARQRNAKSVVGGPRRAILLLARPSRGGHFETIGLVRAGRKKAVAGTVHVRQSRTNEFIVAFLPAAPQLREPERFSAVKGTARDWTPLAVCRVCRDIADDARRSFPDVVDIRQRARAG